MRLRVREIEESARHDAAGKHHETWISSKMVSAPRAAPTGPPEGWSPVVTDRDRLYFNVCRTLVGVIVLGLTCTSAVMSSLPLWFDSRFFPAPPPAPPPPLAPNASAPDEDAAKPWFSAEDLRAARQMLLISSVQLLLLLAGAAACRMARRPAEEQRRRAPNPEARRRRKVRKPAKERRAVGGLDAPEADADAIPASGTDSTKLSGEARSGS